MDMSLYYDNQNEKPLDNITETGGMAAIFRTVGVIGDSLSSGEFESLNDDGSHGYHDYFEYSWGQLLGRMCASKVYNFSRGGMTAKEYWKSFADANRFWDPKYACDAYIIALGINDFAGLRQTPGEAGDCDGAEKDTFAWYYGSIIRRLQTIQPRAKIFLLTFPQGDVVTPAHRELILAFAEKFDNTYVIDLETYGPVVDARFRETFFLLGHMNPMGYLLFAKVVASYIDWIIRHNMRDFNEVGFIGTDLHG